MERNTAQVSLTGSCRGVKWRCPVGSWILSWGFGKWWAGERNLGVISMQMRLDEIAQGVRADGKGDGEEERTEPWSTPMPRAGNW